MFHLSEGERLRQEINSNREEIKMLEGIYKRGAGCFGVSRSAPEIKKEIKRLKKKKF